MALEDRILVVGGGVRRLVGLLDAMGYVFAEPGAPGPEAGTDVAIGRIEREAGTLPLALKLFWRHVGSVNLIGEHPDWEGCEYPDPLFVYPPSQAVEELDEFLADREERLRCGFPYRVPIAPDAYHKQGVSGGMWYGVSVPAVGDDPPLLDERHRTTFVGYLELALRWVGFPGLDRCAGHTWPVEELRRATEWEG